MTKNKLPYAKNKGQKAYNKATKANEAPNAKIRPKRPNKKNRGRGVPLEYSLRVANPIIFSSKYLYLLLG